MNPGECMYCSGPIRQNIDSPACDHCADIMATHGDGLISGGFVCGAFFGARATGLVGAGARQAVRDALALHALQLASRAGRVGGEA